MGVERLMVPTFVKSAIQTDRQFEIAVDVFQWACDFAADNGVVIAAENTLSIEKTRTFFQAVDRKNMVLYFDMQNYYLHNGDYTPDILEGLYDLVAEVHAKDGKGSDLSGALLGTGDVSFHETAQLLKKKGYTGWIVSENYYDLSPLAGPGDEPFRNAEKDLKTLRGIFGS
jgi:sugar phosphate isomerase/epimerase